MRIKKQIEKNMKNVIRECGFKVGWEKPSGQGCKCHCHIRTATGRFSSTWTSVGCDHCQLPQPKSFFDMTDEEKKIIVDRAAKESMEEQIRKYGNPTQPPLQGKQDIKKTSSLSGAVAQSCRSHNEDLIPNDNISDKKVKPKQDWEVGFNGRFPYLETNKPLKYFIRHSIQIAVEKQAKEDAILISTAVDNAVEEAIHKTEKRMIEHILYVFEEVEPNADRERILEYIKKLQNHSKQG